MCRDSSGNYLGSSALVLEGVDDPASLEAVACGEAICLAEDLLINNFIVASDCKQVVADINSGSRGKYGAIVAEINLRSTLFQCSFSFESRVNYEAHSLAKYSIRRGPGRHVWLGDPHDRSCIPLSVDFE